MINYIAIEFKDNTGEITDKLLKRITDTLEANGGTLLRYERKENISQEFPIFFCIVEPGKLLLCKETVRYFEAPFLSLFNIIAKRSVPDGADRVIAGMRERKTDVRVIFEDRFPPFSDLVLRALFLQPVDAQRVIQQKPRRQTPAFILLMPQNGDLLLPVRRKQLTFFLKQRPICQTSHIRIVRVDHSGFLPSQSLSIFR